MYPIIRSVLFRFDAESVHHFTFSALRTFCKIPGSKTLLKALYQTESKSLERTVFGLHFKNPVGLAAGFDKNAELYEELGCLGFGFIEIGTVTPLPQPGNEKPRLFRLPADQAVINRMGFNNLGADVAATRLKFRKNKNLIIGGNIGKNKITPNEDAVSDYIKCYEALYKYVDYFVVNVSSPNTPGLRELQEKEPLLHLLKTVQEKNQKQVKPRPILLKIAPDLTDTQLDDIIKIVRESKTDGIIATNTTISRSGLTTAPALVETCGAGGLSGKPLTKRSTEVIRYLYNHSGGQIPIVAVGGIFTAEDAIEKLEAGASLVQLYTGFIYEGPAAASRINRGLIKHFNNRNVS